MLFSGSRALTAISGGAAGEEILFILLIRG